MKIIRVPGKWRKSRRRVSEFSGSSGKRVPGRWKKVPGSSGSLEGRFLGSSENHEEELQEVQGF